VSSRGHWQGMITIARFNWPYYVIAAGMTIASVWLYNRSAGWEARVGWGLVMAGSLHFLIGSITVSHLVYDRSDLYRWNWLRRALDNGGQGHFVFCHSGFDEASSDLRQRLGHARWTVLDHFDAARMTEASIHRARKVSPAPEGTIAAPFDTWPVTADSVDVVFGVLAIHELRREAERKAWFAEAKRCLRSKGRVVLVEHTRDLANFLAFGPGFLHFHSPAAWRRCWEQTGMCCIEEFRVTPWVRVFVLEKP
jgi:SAM-dependent methyltransferase